MFLFARVVNMNAVYLTAPQKKLYFQNAFIVFNFVMKEFISDEH